MIVFEVFEASLRLFYQSTVVWEDYRCSFQWWICISTLALTRGSQPGVHVPLVVHCLS